MNHPEETSGSLAAHSPADTPVNQSHPIQGRGAQRSGSPHETNRLLEWYSSLQERVRSKSSPFYLLGLGLAAGGLSIVWAKQRKRSILMRDFSGVAKDTRPKEKSDAPLDVGL
jgi:hypothetical protein